MTDYTRNNLLEDREYIPWEPVRWKRTLRLEIWAEEKHAYAVACNMKPGKFYRIKNVIFNMAKRGWVAKVSRRDDAEFRQLREDFDDPDLKLLIEYVHCFAFKTCNGLTGNP